MCLNNLIYVGFESLEENYSQPLKLFMDEESAIKWLKEDTNYWYKEMIIE